MNASPRRERQGLVGKKAPRAKRGVTQGYGGPYGGPCRPSLLSAFGARGFIKKGAIRCVQMNTGSGTSLSAFLADTGGGKRDLVANEPLRCNDGERIGTACQSSFECPRSFCRSPDVHGCGGDAKGKSAFFIFNGNPTGGNPDLGDELFAFDKKGVRQLTNQTGWCSDDFSKACTKSSECGTTGFCIKASMFDLEVGPDGKKVTFVSTGNPAEAASNPGHGQAFFAFTKKGKNLNGAVIAGGGSFCASNTANRGAACIKATDCGTVCGDGRKEGNEGCDGGGYSGSGCPAPQYCAPPGSANQCTCQTPVCGNGIREGTEQCDGEGFCGPNGSCVNCQCQFTGSVSGAFSLVPKSTSAS